MHHLRLALSVVAVGVLLMAGCGSEQGPGPTSPVGGGGHGGSGGSGGGGGSGGSGGEITCGSATGPLDEDGLTEIVYDDGVAANNVRLQQWSITASKQYFLNDEQLNEAVRFDLPHPARIHGFKLMWAEVPPELGPETELTAGLYPDFGHNGFDFWEPDPLWTGTRCVGDLVDGQWVTYAFDKPIEVSHPGLVYVAHHAAPGEPVWWFDGTVEGEGDPCAKFAECQSSYNLPEADASLYYNGVSFPFQYHFMVRLLVEYTDDVGPADTFFQPVPDTPTGGTVSWGDYDDDGYDDLLLGNKLWRNEGDGSFTDQTTAAGLDAAGAAGGVWGDYDNDGCLDLFLFNESQTAPDHLMHSTCDGKFADVTATAGLDDTQSYNPCGDPVNNTHAPSAAAGWFDLDADGLLDLYVANFNCWTDYSFYVDTVFHNKGDGTFESVSGKLGFKSVKTPSRAVAPIDADGDGDVDVLVGNYVLKANLYYRNNGDGTVSESGVLQGLAGNKVSGYYGHTIGLAWGDLDNDGDFDNVTGNLAHPRFFDFSDKTQILLNDGKGSFHDISGDWTFPASAAGLRYQETHSVPVLADFDADGVLDLVITAVYEGRPTDFYWGKGDGTFELDSYHAGITTTNGWGVAAADYDHDGDMDLFATSLFANELETAAKGHWLQVRVVGGPTANRAGIGATVKVKTGGISRIRHVQGGTGKGGQDSLYLHFGLDDATTIDEISVVFPGGKQAVATGPIAADQRVFVFEDGTVKAGWKLPAK